MAEWVRDRYRPTILVLASAAVEESCVKNGLTFTELLKPFFSDIPWDANGIRGVTSFNLVSAAELESPHIDNANAYLEAALPLPQMLQQPPYAPMAPASLARDALRSPGDLAGFLSRVRDPCPWWTRYRAEFLETLRSSDCELPDFPVAVIVAVAATEDSADRSAEALHSMHRLPSLLQRGVADATIPRAYVVVTDHDVTSPLVRPVPPPVSPCNFPAMYLAQMRTTAY